MKSYQYEAATGSLAYKLLWQAQKLGEKALEKHEALHYSDMETKKLEPELINSMRKYASF